MRKAIIKRTTKETRVSLELNIDGTGISQINTPVGFLSHILELFSFHAKFDLKVEAQGDTEVDYHHTTEDIGICLGQALRKALGDRVGITRYGQRLLPMDEALALCAVDIGGRFFLGWQVYLPSAKVGDFDSELAEEFWRAVCYHAEMVAHVHLLSGRNIHHMLEAIAKGLGRACREAVEKSGDDVASTKGSFDIKGENA